MIVSVNRSRQILIVEIGGFYHPALLPGSGGNLISLFRGWFRHYTPPHNKLCLDFIFPLSPATCENAAWAPLVRQRRNGAQNHHFLAVEHEYRLNNRKPSPSIYCGFRTTRFLVEKAKEKNDEMKWLELLYGLPPPYTPACTESKYPAAELGVLRLQAPLKGPDRNRKTGLELPRNLAKA